MKRFKILRNILLATIASSSLLNVAHADDALKMELTANQVIKNAEGKTVYKPVRTAPAGTVIQYKANYTNTINKDINDLMVTLPIPANMTFTGDAMPAPASPCFPTTSSCSFASSAFAEATTSSSSFVIGRLSTSNA